MREGPGGFRPLICIVAAKKAKGCAASSRSPKTVTQEVLASRVMTNVQLKYLSVQLVTRDIFGNR